MDLEFNGEFIFETVMRVRNTEIDIGQHLTIEALVSLLSEARARFFYSKGIKEINSDFQGLMVTDVMTKYVSRARAREELLVEVGVQGLTDMGGDLMFKITRMYDSSVVAMAVMGFVMHDYRNNKSIPISASIKNLLDVKPFEV